MSDTEAPTVSADGLIKRLLREADYRGEGSSHAARVTALSWLGRHLAMFTEKTEISGQGAALSRIEIVYVDPKTESDSDEQ